MRGLQWHYDRLAEELRGHPRIMSTGVSGSVRAPVAAAAEVSAPKAE